MKPGIELDILVAEKVMGLDVHKNKSGSKRGGYYYSIGEPIWYDIQGDMELSNPIPPYAEYIGAAWQVVEKLYVIGWDTEIQRYRDREGLCVRVCVAQIEHQEIRFLEFADTAPHAICLAALKAVGYKGEE